MVPEGLGGGLEMHGGERCMNQELESNPKPNTAVSFGFSLKRIPLQIFPRFSRCSMIFISVNTPYRLYGSGSQPS